MTYDDEFVIVLEDGDQPLKLETTEHIWIKAPDIYPGIEYVCVGFVYEVGHCPYGNREEFEALVNTQLDDLRLESKQQEIGGE